MRKTSNYPDSRSAGYWNSWCSPFARNLPTADFRCARSQFLSASPRDAAALYLTSTKLPCPVPGSCIACYTASAPTHSRRSTETKPRRLLTSLMMMWTCSMQSSTAARFADCHLLHDVHCITHRTAHLQSSCHKARCAGLLTTATDLNRWAGCSVG